jgi:CheY-like chemotaxis protein
MADDDADIRKICNLSLSAVGKWQVILAATGSEAVAKAKAELPGLILLDVMMPGLDGVTAFHQIKEIPALAHTPVILITAKVQPEELEKYMSLGVAGVKMIWTTRQSTLKSKLSSFKLKMNTLAPYLAN